MDYSRIHHDQVTRLSDIVVERCVSRYALLCLSSPIIFLTNFCRFSGFTLLFFLLFCTFYVWQIAVFVLSIMRLVDMYRFYTYLLQIPDVRPPSIRRCLLANIFLGRYPDHLLARSRSTHRSHPELESTHRALLILFPSTRERRCETRRARYR